MWIWKWIKKWFAPKKQIVIGQPEKPKEDLTGLTKGDMKKLKAQGKL